MSDYNNNCCGNEWMLLLLFFAFGGGAWGNGGWGNGWGNNTFAAATTTAAETASLVEQGNMRAQVAANNMALGNIAGEVRANGGKIEAVRDAVTNGFFAEQTQLCQLGNNMNNAIRDNREAFAHELCDLRHQLQTNHCATIQAIKDGTDSLEKLINARDMKKLEAQNLKLQNELVQNEQTEKIIKAMAAYYGCNPCTPCAPCCPDVSYQNQVLSALNGIATGIQSLSTTQQAQGTTLASILTRVNELPTT